LEDVRASLIVMRPGLPAVLAQEQAAAIAAAVGHPPPPPTGRAAYLHPGDRGPAA
jgi:hypothetical protein